MKFEIILRTDPILYFKKTMQENQNLQKPIQIIPILKESLSFYKANFRLLFLISLLGSSITLIEQLLSILKVSLGWFGSITMIVGTIVSFWAHIALIFAIFERFNGQDVDFKRAFISTKGKFWRFVGVSIFCTLLFVVGSLLFIVPGMYWGTIFALAGLVVVLEGRTFFDSFKRSKDLIRGNFWPIFFLYWILFFIFTPTYVIYKLDITMIVRTVIMLFVSILYMPYSVAININIYDRLKKVRGDIEQTEGEEAKKGGGCLGCLGVIGLSIVIIILSTVWFKNIGKFVKTEKGSKVYEWVAKQVSPKMVFQDNVILERPKGYSVLGGQQDITTYALYGFVDKNFFTLSTYSIPYEKLGISDTASIQLDDEIWDKYYAYLKSESPYSEMKFMNMEKASFQVLNIAGRRWGEYILKEKEKEYDKSQKIWIYNYILSDSAVIFVSYGHTTDEDENKLNLKKEEVKRILNGFHF